MVSMRLFINNERGLNMKKKAVFYIPIIISLVITGTLILIPELLIPNGYELAIDGYVISRTICILFILNLITKIGFYFLEEYKNNKTP